VTIAPLARRPPIAQHRFIKVTDREVQFRTKDLKEKREVITHYSVKAFVAVLAEHRPDRYRHAVRYFGLLAPVSADVCDFVCTVGAKEASPATTVELAEFTAKVFRGRSPRR
jgi:hypothetical protein